MPTINSILRELKNVPVDKLEDLYSIIHSLRTNTRKAGRENKEIPSFAGSFADLSKSDYNDFVEHTKQTRENLFDRNINL
jgi:hypothetical protein